MVPNLNSEWIFGGAPGSARSRRLELGFRKKDEGDRPEEVPDDRRRRRLCGEEQADNRRGGRDDFQSGEELTPCGSGEEPLHPSAPAAFPGAGSTTLFSDEEPHQSRIPPAETCPPSPGEPVPGPSSLRKRANHPK